MKLRPPEYIQLVDTPRTANQFTTPQEANGWFLTVMRGFSKTTPQDWDEGLWLLATGPADRLGIPRAVQGDVAIYLPAVKATDTRIYVSRAVAFLADVGYVLVRLQIVQ